LLDVLQDELELASRDDVTGFELSLGGTVSNGWVYFNRGNTASKAESWQTLSPVRGQPHGIGEVNRFVQRHFRAQTRERAQQRLRKIPKPNRGFGDESDAPLELAYATTVHRAQGSEFGKTILILHKECRPLSRELLYTALTRQQNQGDLTSLKRYADPTFSETARRLTNVFRDPEPVQVEPDLFLEWPLGSRYPDFTIEDDRSRPRTGVDRR
jgi:hypothetical protein